MTNGTITPTTIFSDTSLTAVALELQKHQTLFIENQQLYNDTKSELITIDSWFKEHKIVMTDQQLSIKIKTINNILEEYKYILD